ncbi:MAG: FAD-dependent oxidoreductase [Firmicutes bacterium]|nr:FAD-dependent oxidoreductase [Bacillota bacterium]
MPAAVKEIPPVWTTGWTDVLNTGTWRSAIPVHQRRSSPCQVSCPAASEIPVWLQQLKEGQHYRAWLTLVENNPFPAVTGRVCHHPCEGSCNRGEYDGAVAVNALERFVGDLALKEGWSFQEPAAQKGARVAVVGAGPAGLSCAYQLRKSGYEVTVFEKQPEPGGVLRYGIPGYRLPKEIVAGEVRRILNTGIELKVNAAVRGEDLLALEKDYAAVCLAMGAPGAKTLPQFPAGDRRVLDGLHFLAGVNQGQIPDVGPRVAVIGGGSVAMDVARTARRLGKQVKVLALEDGSSLPAQREEVQEALEEGVTILDGVMVRAAESAGQQLGLACVKVVLDPAAPAGVLRPVVIPGTDFQLFADTVILAVGQDPELAGFSGNLRLDNSILAVDPFQATSRPGIFACGDVASSVRYVSAAVGAGSLAARSIAAFLEGRTVEGGDKKPDLVSFAEINTFYFPVTGRLDKKALPPGLRLRDFSEVKPAFSGEEALAQAERCFSCGHCVKCDNCFYYCPDQAVVKSPDPEQDYGVQDQYCKGCGLCVEECPRGAVMLQEVRR